MTTLRIQFFRVVAIVFSVSVSCFPVAVAIPQNPPANVELPRGVITLKLNGDKLEGTFILPDKTVFRRVTLKKSD